MSLQSADNIRGDPVLVAILQGIFNSGSYAQRDSTDYNVAVVMLKKCSDSKGKYTRNVSRRLFLFQRLAKLICDGGTLCSCDNVLM